MKGVLKSRGGFTLIEMAIVLVIIGLILGMIMKGKQLIDGAKVKSLIAQRNKIIAAINIFYERYGVYPGDGCTTPAPASISQCNGTKDGIIDTADEEKAFWYLLIHDTHILSEADRRSVFGQDWNIIYRTFNGVTGDWLDLPGGAQMDVRYMCALDQAIDDGEYNSGDVQASAHYHRNTDCWSLSGQTDGWIKVLP